jgi:ABC-type amino acid transport system permease subunit
VLSAVSALVAARRSPIPETFRAVLPSAVTVAAIGLGFLMTANSILVAASSRWIVSRARETPALRQLVRYMIAAMKWCLFSAVASVSALLFDPNWNLPWYPFGIAAWAFISAGALAALFRVLTVFSQVLLGLAEDN